MISHVTVGSNDIARAKAFYAKVMAALGYVRVVEGDDHFAYGESATSPATFWVLAPFDGRPAERGNGWHCAFLAPSRAAVDAFHAAALAAGGSDEGAPGPRPRYSKTYYGAYVRDADGNKLQAVCYRAE
ncbi:MAG: VOC family protein [Kiloniellales bacterium]|jgi:catechol 2,3-dioxygenase-like lactoylglutathione lyase family enzyme|nr:VOC family protein [Kiloniellales bacterium]